MSELTDEQLDSIIKDEIQKDITQEETIDKEDLDKKLGEMGFLWDRVQNKLGNDKTCFHCKNIVDFKDGIQLLEAGKAEKGLVAFVSICPKCMLELKEIAKKSQKVE